MKKIISILGVCLLFISCENQFLVTTTNTDMFIESCIKLNDSEFKYQYHVSDASKVGWTLRCNDLYKIGDTLKINKK